MCPHITLEQVDDIPCESRVCHYDELSETVKDEFPGLAGSGCSFIERPTTADFQKCDFVKYTDYYEVSVD